MRFLDKNMEKYCVYVHHNNINGKRYVGITNNPKKRWYGEGKAYKGCVRFAAAIKKYGWRNFSNYILVAGLTMKEANALERFYIERYKTKEKAYGYNIQDGGSNGATMTGKHHSEETKRKMRESALGRVIPEAQRMRHSEIMTGKMVGALNHKSRAVRCINTGEVFETQRAAAAAKGISQSKISLCCQGKRNHTHGYKWEYLNEMEA